MFRQLLKIALASSLLLGSTHVQAANNITAARVWRSEERRVGKEC